MKLNYSKFVKIVIFLFFTTTCLSELLFKNQKNRDTLEKDLKEHLARSLPTNGPGGCVGVWNSGEPLVKICHGFYNVEQNILHTIDTRFDLASVSKHFSGAGILLLLQENKINLKDIVSEVWLPELKNKGFDKPRPILVKDLVYMISGFPEYEELVPKDKTQTITNEEVLKLVIKERPDFPVGTKWDYSNTAYMLLALIIKRASKTSWSDFIEGKIFKPLDMSNARAMDRHRENWDYAQGYKKMKDGSYKSYRRETPYSYGDGNIFLSINDFEKWDRGLLKNSLLTEESTNLAFTNGKLDNDKIIEYGFGWTVVKDKYGKNVQHTGGWYGTSTIVKRWLDLKTSYAYFVNIDDYDSSSKVSDKIEQIILENIDLEMTYKNLNLPEVEEFSNKENSTYNITSSSAELTDLKLKFLQ